MGDLAIITLSKGIKINPTPASAVQRVYLGGVPAMANPGGGVVARPRYANWAASHEMGASLRYARVPNLLRALVGVQHIDFHVHSAREDARQAILATLSDAPYSEHQRFPEGAWVELGTSVMGALLERCTSALAFGDSGAVSNTQVGGRDAYSDSKVSFLKSRAEMVRKLTNQSANGAAADGVYMSRAIFERCTGLNWG